MVNGISSKINNISDNEPSKAQNLSYNRLTRSPDKDSCSFTGKGEDKKAEKKGFILFRPIGNYLKKRKMIKNLADNVFGGDKEAAKNFLKKAGISLKNKNAEEMVELINNAIEYNPSNKSLKELLEQAKNAPSFESYEKFADAAYKTTEKYSV